MKRGLASIGCGFASGFFFGWGLASIHAFLITFLLISLFLYFHSKTAIQSLSTGLYLTGIFILLTPLLFYMPMVLREEGFKFFGSLIALVIWGFVFLFMAIVTWVLAYLVSRKT